MNCHLLSFVVCFVSYVVICLRQLICIWHQEGVSGDEFVEKLSRYLTITQRFKRQTRRQSTAAKKMVLAIWLISLYFLVANDFAVGFLICIVQGQSLISSHSQVFFWRNKIYVHILTI